MGFWEDTKEKVKDIFGGGDDKDTSGGGTSDEQKMSKAPSSGEGDSWSERVEERGERAKERAEEKLGIDDGTSGGGSSRSGGGSSRSGGGSSGDGSFAERMEEKGKRAKQRAKEKLGIEKESGQKTTQTQAQQLRQKFQEEDVLGGRMSQQEGFSPRMTTQRTPKEFQISQQQQSRINRYFGGENQKSKSGKPTQISKAKDTGYSSYTSPYDQSVGAGIVQSFENIAGIPKDFFEGKRGEDLYGGIFQPLSLSAKTGAE